MNADNYFKTVIKLRFLSYFFAIKILYNLYESFFNKELFRSFYGEHVFEIRYLIIILLIVKIHYFLFELLSNIQINYSLKQNTDIIASDDHEEFINQFEPVLARDIVGEFTDEELLRFTGIDACHTVVFWDRRKSRVQCS